MAYTTIAELEKLGEIDAELEEFLKMNPLPILDYSNLPLFKSIVQSQGKVLPELLGPPPAGVKQNETHYTTRDDVQMRVKLYQPSSPPVAGSPMIVMFHAGGWCTGFPETEELTCRNLVQAFGAVCVSCSYRLAPEFKFPVGVLDAWDALKWAADSAKTFGADPKQGFILGGTSAGANFTAVLAHKARDEAMEPPLTGLAYAVPALGGHNLALIPEQYRARAISFKQNESAPLISKAAFDMLVNGYTPDVNDCELYAVIAHPKGHAGLPSSFFQLCGMDPIRDDGLIYAAMLEEVGVKTKTVMYPGLPHDFAHLLPQLKSVLLFHKDQVTIAGWTLTQGSKFLTQLGACVSVTDTYRTLDMV